MPDLVTREVSLTRGEGVLALVCTKETLFCPLAESSVLNLRDNVLPCSVSSTSARFVHERFVPVARTAAESTSADAAARDRCTFAVGACRVHAVNLGGLKAKVCEANRKKDGPGVCRRF